MRLIGAGLLLPGLLLHHPAPAHEAKAGRAPAKKPPARAAREGPARPVGAGAAEPCVHVVRAGDSVSRVAARHGLRRAALVEANGLARPHVLRPGQRLRLPGCGEERTASPGGAPPPPAAAPDGSVVARVGPRRVLTRLSLVGPDRETIGFVWPVDGPVISHFGRRGRGWHAGSDIGAEPGTPIAAAADGTVVYSGWARAYGRTVKIQHEDGFVTVYAHNLENLVQVGDRVAAGQVIATVGRSGRASAHHLHFEILHEGVAYDPLQLLPPSLVALAAPEDGVGPADPESHAE